MSKRISILRKSFFEVLRLFVEISTHIDRICVLDNVSLKHNLHMLKKITIVEA
jgi:hypothetical protein